MALDTDLDALRQKLDTRDDAGDKSSLTIDERRLLTSALAHSQQARDSAKAASASHSQREFDFFAVCMGYCLLAYAILVIVLWWGHAPLDGAALFGLAFLGGLSAAALRAWYAGTWTPKWTTLGAAIVALILCFFGLVLGSGIGAVAGIVLGVVFFQSLVRNRQARRQPAANTAETG